MGYLGLDFSILPSKDILQSCSGSRSQEDLQGGNMSAFSSRLIGRQTCLAVTDAWHAAAIFARRRTKGN